VFLAVTTIFAPLGQQESRLTQINIAGVTAAGPLQRLRNARARLPLRIAVVSLSSALSADSMGDSERNDQLSLVLIG